MEFSQEQNSYAEIVQKAWESPEFKSELIKNPTVAIEEFLGKKLNLPVGKTLVVRDQTDESTVYINIPAQVRNKKDVELNEEQLELVAGGVYIAKGGGDIYDFPGGGGCFPQFPDILTTNTK